MLAESTISDIIIGPIAQNTQLPPFPPFQCCLSSRKVQYEQPMSCMLRASKFFGHYTNIEAGERGLQVSF